jgi:hypothetical protein
MDNKKRQAIGMSFLGLLLIVLSLKYMPAFLAFAGQQSGIATDGLVLFFFNEDDPCECMQELTARADQQMMDWSKRYLDGVSMMRIASGQRRDLEIKYGVFRTPCLVLVDARDRVIWRQDYPLIEGGPFEIQELDQAIARYHAP